MFTKERLLSCVHKIFTLFSQTPVALSTGLTAHIFSLVLADVGMRGSVNKLVPLITSTRVTQSRGAYYIWVLSFFCYLNLKVGVRIIFGCVLYSENYGKKMYALNSRFHYAHNLP